MSRSLVVIEHDGQTARRSALSAITLARALTPEVVFLVLGHGIAAVAESVRAYGAAKVLVADHAALAESPADRLAVVVADAVRQSGATRLLATSSSFAKDLLPRAAALLDAPMLTDISAVRDDPKGAVFERPVSAGSQVATVRLHAPIQVLTARATSFAPPAPDITLSPVEPWPVDPAVLPVATRFESRQAPATGRPDLGEARIVVCGGRPLGDRDTFERLIGGLADSLGAAVGATRAAVDAGMAPNEFQVGQTGTIVAPELYIGIGVSGAIQHLAGIQDSKVIVAINRDPEAPILQSATYGLIGDLHTLVPEFMAALRA